MLYKSVPRNIVSPVEAGWYKKCDRQTDKTVYILSLCPSAETGDTKVKQLYNQ